MLQKLDGNRTIEEVPYSKHAKMLTDQQSFLIVDGEPDSPLTSRVG